MYGGVAVGCARRAKTVNFGTKSDLNGKGGVTLPGNVLHSPRLPAPHLKSKEICAGTGCHQAAFNHLFL